MNKVILKYRNGKNRSINTKLKEKEKIISFLKITGDWDENIISLEIIENVTHASCNYQNMDKELE